MKRLLNFIFFFFIFLLIMVEDTSPAHSSEEEEEEEDDEDDGEIRCICGRDVDKGLMIQCEKCEVWQHGSCLGIKSDKQVPDDWFCSDCQQELENVGLFLIF